MSYDSIFHTHNEIQYRENQFGLVDFCFLSLNANSGSDHQFGYTGRATLYADRES